MILLSKVRGHNRNLSTSADVFFVLQKHKLILGGKGPPEIPGSVDREY